MAEYTDKIDALLRHARGWSAEEFADLAIAAADQAGADAGQQATMKALLDTAVLRQQLAKVTSVTITDEVESGFANGDLYIEVDAEQRLHPHVLMGGRLHLRLPEFLIDWPDLDAAVARRLNARAGKDGAR
ncbi:MAG: hypothetical protein ACTHU0_22160 [Kofleriaceae bacterium]